MSSRRNSASHCFAFEEDFIGNWRCIPLCVRRKLDLCGVKLKLNHWLELSQEQRQALVDWSDGVDALEQLRQHLRECTRSCLLYTSPSPRDRTRSRMPSSA